MHAASNESKWQWCTVPGPETGPPGPFPVRHGNALPSAASRKRQSCLIDTAESSRCRHKAHRETNVHAIKRKTNHSRMYNLWFDCFVKWFVAFKSSLTCSVEVVPWWFPCRNTAGNPDRWLLCPIDGVIVHFYAVVKLWSGLKAAPASEHNATVRSA